MNEDKKYAILLNMIIADALSRPLNGMSRGHIQAHFKGCDAYIDPAPALKGTMERWTMPGLYGSLSQFMLLYGLSLSKKGWNRALFQEMIARSPEISDLPSGVFRSPSRAERDLITQLKERGPARDFQASSDTGPIAHSVPLAFLPLSGERLLTEALSYPAQFTREMSVLAAGLILLKTIKGLLAGTGASCRETALSAVEECRGEISAYSGRVFDLSINPESLLSTIELYGEILSSIERAPDKEQAEKTLITIFNKNETMTITRATINSPLVILPYALYLADLYAGHDKPLAALIQEGGSVSPLTVISTALLSARGLPVISGPLSVNCANRKRIHTLITLLLSGKRKNNAAEDFFSVEQGLSIKEDEMRKARLKRQGVGKKSIKTGKKYKNMEKLTQHVVESWTKLDKARWKKERKRAKEQKE